MSGIQVRGRCRGQRGQGGQDDSGELGVAGAPCILKPPAGDGPPRPGRYLIERDEEASYRQNRKRPPHRGAA